MAHLQWVGVNLAPGGLHTSGGLSYAVLTIAHAYFAHSSCEPTAAGLLIAISSSPPPMCSADDFDDEPVFDQAARTLVEQFGDRAAEIASEQAEAAGRQGDDRRAKYWRLIGEAIKRRQASS